MKFIVILVILCLICSLSYGAPDCDCVRKSNLPLTRVGEKYYYIETNTRANWFSANNFCNLHKMRLVSIASETEHEDLRHHVKTIKFNPIGIWTSGNDLANAGNWYWTSYGTRIVYTNWSPNEPNNAFGNEHCIELRGQEDLHWNDIACENLRDFICEATD